jgi:uncharacterized SAM-binding protein YcdF (DUF218 family)
MPGFDTPAYDVIIVLGAAVWPDGQPSPALRRRVAHAIQMFYQGQGRFLLLTGGLGIHAPPEAHVMRQLVLSAGIRDTQILVEDRATSTFWSAIYCAQILRHHGWSKALIVTDRYHLPRALWTFRRMGVTAVGSAVAGHHASRHVWQHWWRRSREVIAFAWYIVRIGVWKARHHDDDMGQA